MNKSSLILSYFQKKDLLTLKNADYRKCISDLFQWFMSNDQIDNDITTDQLGLKGKQTAHIKAKENFVVAGMEEVTFLLENEAPRVYTRGIFKDGGAKSAEAEEHSSLPLQTGSCAKVDKSHLSFTPKIQDGQQASAHEVIAEMTGEGKEILFLERTILNVLQRMSGIATQTNNINRLLRTTNYELRTPYIAATRKTPWMMLDKKAVAVGGGLTHRLSLSDAILIKDNHIKAVGSLKKSLDRMLRNARNTLVEVEVGTKKEAYTVLQSYFSYPSSNTLCVMLDNFTSAKAKQTIQMLNKQFDCSRVIFEASGRINDSNINKWARTGADILSVGTLTHSARSADIALQIISRKTL